jgi:O-antigen ligase
MIGRTEMGPAGLPFDRGIGLRDRDEETTPGAVDRGAVVLVFLVLIGMAVAAGLFVATGRAAVAVAAAAAFPALAVLLRYPFAAVLVYILAVPFFIQVETVTPHPAYWVLHRMMILAMLGLVLVYHGLGQMKNRLRPSIIDAAILAFLGLGVANILLLSDNPSRMLMAFYDRLVVPILLFWLIRAIDPGQRDIQRLAIVGAITVAIQAVIGILAWVMPSVLPSNWLGRAGERTVGTFAGPGPFTATLVFFGLLVAHYALAGSGRRPRAMLLATVGIGMLAVFLSFQRGGWLGAALGFAGLWLVHKRATSRMAMAGALAALLLAIGPLSAEFSFASERLADADTVDSRLVTFDAAFQMVESEPLRGFGYGQFEKFDEQFKRSVGDVAFEEGGSLHNSWLGLAAENGIPAVMLYAFPAVWLLIRSFRLRHRLTRRGFIGGALIIVVWAGILDIFIVSNTMDLLHSSPWGTGLVWIGLALIAVQIDQVPGAAATARSRIMSAPLRPRTTARYGPAR